MNLEIAGRRIHISWILAVGMLLRVLYVWCGRHAQPTATDGYETIALSLLERGEYAMVPGVPTSFREPGFPLFIAAIYGAFGVHPSVVLLLQCALSTATGWLLWLTGRRLFSEQVAGTALIVFLIYPQSIYYCAYFFRETWLCFWFAVLCWSSLSWSAPHGNNAGDRGAALGGFAAMVFGLTNSAVLPACVLAGVLLGFAAPTRGRPRRIAIYFLPPLIAFAAWSVRNWSIHGRFVLGSTHGGEEFLQALVVPPEDLGTERQSDYIRATPDFAEVSGLPEAESNDRLMKASLRWISAHPGIYASRLAAGLAKYWKPWPYRRAYKHSYLVLMILSLMSDAWIIPLGFVGLWLFRARWKEFPAFPASLAAMTFVYGAVHAVIRYRLPLMGGMILLACAAIAQLARSLTQNSRIDAHGR